jgi:chromatin segregation and condensation protein Rec8/ScpA/Scc1 (kleisin family)
MTAMGKSRFVAPPGPGTLTGRMSERERLEHRRRVNAEIAARASEVQSRREQPTIPEGTREQNKEAWQTYWRERRAYETEQERKRRMEAAINEKEVRDLYENPPEIVQQCFTWTDGYRRCTYYDGHLGDHEYNGD